MLFLVHNKKINIVDAFKPLFDKGLSDIDECINCKTREAKKIAGTLELDLYATDEELKEMDFQEGKEFRIRETKKEIVVKL